MKAVIIAMEVAWRFLGKEYKWGGDDPVAGFDCSGFCIEILKSVGILPIKGDWTAQGLWNLLEEYKVDEPYGGCLVFWTNENGDRIIHIEFAISPSYCIGASGGGSKTNDISDAIDQNAYIKIRPWASRKRVKGFIDPFKKLEILGG